MTFLQQELRISGRMTSLSGLSVKRVSSTQLSSVWNHASCSEEIGLVICPNRASPDVSLLFSSSSRGFIACLSSGVFCGEIIHKKHDIVNEKFTFSEYMVNIRTPPLQCAQCR